MPNPSSCTVPRKSERVLLKIPIRVEGKDTFGNAFVETTYTLVVNRSGGLIALSHPLRQGDVIRITNLKSHTSGSFEVVMRTAVSLSGQPEWGVKCLEPEVGMWGVHFPPQTEETSQPGLTHVLLECDECAGREMAVLTMEQYRTLAVESRLSRPCPKCGVTRDWKCAEIRVEVGGVSPVLADSLSSELRAGGEIEKREEKWFVAKLPLQVKRPDGCEETSKTENLSESSLCFASSFEMQIGDRLYLTVGSDAAEEERDIPARIIWRYPAKGEGRTLYVAKLQNALGGELVIGYPLSIPGETRPRRI